MVPEELKFAISGLIAFLVTEGLKALFPGKDLSAFAKVLSAALFSGLLVFADGLLALVPPDYAGVVQGVFALILALLSAFGVHRIFKAVRK